MAASARDEEFKYDKPGAERSRRRRGADDDDDDDDLDSDFEGDLLEEDWLSSKKNPSELSDEELNDDLLQSDEEDQNPSAQDTAVISLNATSGLSESFELQEGDEFGEEYHLSVEYGEEEEPEYGNEDEVLDLQINEPLDDEFQAEEYGTKPQEVQPDEQELGEAEGAVLEEEFDDVSRVAEAEEMEAEPELEPVAKEESDEEEEEDEESGRLRFKSERKDRTVVRLSDTTNKRRNIPETLELTEEAKADLLQFEEKERLRKQIRFGGRRGGGGPPLFGMGGFRKDDGAGRGGRMNEPRPRLMSVNFGMQSRMLAPRPPGPRGCMGLFPSPLISIPQQPLMPSRSPSPHRSPLQEPHLSRSHGHTHAPPHTHSQQQQQQQQPKNIHINPHFRGPASSSPMQVPLISSTPNQPRPSLGPQRFPGPVDFSQHLQGNFLQPQRPPPQEQWRGQLPPPPPPPPPHQEREPFFNNEPRFPVQPLFELPGPAPLMSNNILPLAFPGPGFGPPMGGMFQRDLLPRPNPPPPQPSPTPPASRGFMGHRQHFSPQQHNVPFNPQHAPFGMPGLLQMHTQPQHPPPPPHHHPMHHQQHKQEAPPSPHKHHQHQHQGQPGEQYPIMHLSHAHFRQPTPGGPSLMKPRPQNSMGGLRMGSPTSMQQLQNFPQRNSNLRELPIASGNTGPLRPHQLRPMNTQNAKPGQRLGGGPVVGGPIRGGLIGRGTIGRGAIGRGRGLVKTAQPPASAEKNETRASQSSSIVEKAMPSTAAQDEDEETRQYRLKIEEQKRLREEILKRKEMRRQMQAGARKKELLERLWAQAAPQTPIVSTQTTPTQPHSSPIPTAATPTPACTPNGMKSQLQNLGVEQKQRPQNPQRLVPQLPGSTIKVTPPPEVKMITPIQGQANAMRKRTVMQRINAGSSQIPQKVRVVKQLVGGEDAPPLQNQPQQMIGRAAPQQRPGAPRKVMVAETGPQQQPPPQQQQPEVKQTNRVVVSGRGRGRGRGARGGRVVPQIRQSARLTESQSNTVSIDGLSSSTTDKQIKNLLNSIGPIQMFQMIPQQRKAIATFVSPQHAQSFQHSFHRHMIDLSHIDVTIIDG